MSEFENIVTGSKDLKEMPFSVPKGYFEDFSVKMRRRIRQEKKSRKEQSGKHAGTFVRFVPYLSAAAALVAILILGITLVFPHKTVVPEDGLLDSDYIFYYSQIIPVTEPESIYYSYDSDSDSLTEEDIINYLVYNGVDVNEFLNE